MESIQDVIWKRVCLRRESRTKTILKLYNPQYINSHDTTKNIYGEALCHEIAQKPQKS